MLSHTIYNPNSVDVNSDRNYVVVPIGRRCPTARVCSAASVRKYSLPFDWAMTSPGVIQEIIADDFNHFVIKKENYNAEEGTCCMPYYKLPYTFKANERIFGRDGVFVGHFDKNFNVAVDQYKRRVLRFTQLLTDANHVIYFVYVDEDFLSSNSSPSLDKKMFQEMLQFELFIKNRYPDVECAFIFFNFRPHIIPRDSKTINIVLHNPVMMVQGDPLLSYDRIVYIENDFEMYCAKILSVLFNTSLVGPARI